MQAGRGALRLQWRLAIWPLAALLALAALWSITFSRVEREQARTETDALAAVAAAAMAYEQYVTRSIAHIDQVSMQLALSWEQSGGRLSLEDMVHQGMFTDHAFACVALLDARGKLRTAIRAHACGAALEARNVFLYHQGNNTDAMRIGPLPGQPELSQDTLLFTRRLERGAEGNFDGVLVFAVPADYFTTFYLPATAFGGVVAIAGVDSALRAGQRPASLPSNDKLWPGTSGAVMVARGAGFPDGLARALGWQRSPVYPVIALVALAREQVLAPYLAFRAAALRLAWVGSTLVLVLAAAAGAASWRKRARRRAREQIQLAYRTATEGAKDGFYMASPVRKRNGEIVDFVIDDCNEQGARFYGISRLALVGRRLSAMEEDSAGRPLFAAYRRAMQTGLHEDERALPVLQRVQPGWGKRRIVRVGDALAVTLQDISAHRAHQAEVARLNNEDVLTGLPNRPWLMHHLPQALLDNAELTLLFADLDEFELVNELHGQATGDRLLQAAAQRLRSLLRPADCVARFGGDQFVVLLHGSDGSEQADRVAARIVEAFAVPLLAGEPLRVGVSLGVAGYPRDAHDAPGLVRQAQIAMEAAKADGRGGYRYYEPALARATQSQMQLRQSLVEAIEQDQFVLFYQPRVDLASGTMCSMEALVRWQHPVRGLVPPLEFIALAESSGLILRIGEMVMDKACRQLAAWRSEALPLVPVSVNVSPRQFARGQVHAQLARCLQRHDVAPALLEVEITESAMMGQQDDIIAQLAAIRALGVKLHVDDFGTGYSSLSQLQKLKMDVLKVDRAFTSELGQSGEGQVFFQAIVSMAHALGMVVVAEGVETAGQMAILHELGCNEVQGYYIARPMPAAQMASLMRRPALLALQGGAPAVAQV